MAKTQLTQLYRLWGTVTDVAPGMLKVAGISQLAGVGNEIQIRKPGQTIHGEILSVSAEELPRCCFRPATQFASVTGSKSSRKRVSSPVTTGWAT